MIESKKSSRKVIVEARSGERVELFDARTDRSIAIVGWRVVLNNKEWAQARDGLRLFKMVTI